MKPLKSLFSFIMPLIVMLLTFSIYLFLDKVVTKYKIDIANDYSIVVVANTPLVKIEEVAGIKVKDLERLKREKIIKGLEDKLSKSSLDMLKTRLPYFYKIHLQEFPTTLKLEQIRKELNTISNVKEVETFSIDHNKIYSLLVLIQSVIQILFLIILTLSFLLLSKQIKIWFYEHSQRIDIIQLHGGSILYASKPIIRIVVISATISSLIVTGISYGFILNVQQIIEPELFDLIPSGLNFELEMFYIVVLAFIIPFIAFFWLLTKYKLK